MKNDLTELVFILDKSGSMSGLESDTIGGFNSLIEKQRKEEGKAIISTILFNHEVEVIYDRVDLNDVALLTNKEYFVSGCTALLDAMGNAINGVLAKQNKLKDSDKPNKTMFIITTDGMENSSKEYTYKAVKKMIEKVKKENEWEFVFLGANIDAVLEASKFGIDENHAVKYKCDSKGVSLNYECLSSVISDVRKNKKISKTWKSAIDKDLKDRAND